MHRWFLWCGVIAGPIYVILAGTQAVTRDGFELTRHPISLLSNGDFGWVQILNFVIAGVLVNAAALGLRGTITSGPGHIWGPILIGIYGVGLIGSGVFVADPQDGFPPGTPAGDPVDATFSGAMHFMAGGIAFLALIIACFVFARRFAWFGESTWTYASVATGVIFFVGFASTAATGGAAAANVLLTFAVILGWAWLAGLSLRVLAGTEEPGGERVAYGG